MPRAMTAEEKALLKQNRERLNGRLGKNGECKHSILKKVKPELLLTFWDLYKIERLQQNKRLLTQTSFAVYLGISHSTWFFWQQKGKIKYTEKFQFVFDIIRTDIEDQNLEILQKPYMANVGMFLLRSQNKYIDFEKSELLELKKQELEQKVVELQKENAITINVKKEEDF